MEEKVKTWETQETYKAQKTPEIYKTNVYNITYVYFKYNVCLNMYYNKCI